MTFNLNIHTCIAMPLPCIFGLHLHSSVLSPNFALGLAMMGLLHSYRWGAEQLCQACADTLREDPHWRERELSKLLWFGTNRFTGINIFTQEYWHDRRFWLYLVHLHNQREHKFEGKKCGKSCPALLSR